MKAKRQSSSTSLSYVLRSENYGELTFGASVRIVGERGRWTFRHYCVNTDTGSEWLDVFGGTPGAETLRAFKPERVVPIRARGRRRTKALTLEDLI